MTSRRAIVEPVSRAALWGRRSAVFGLMLAGIAVAASRSGAVEPSGALAILAAALIIGALAFPLAVLAAVAIWRTGRPGLGQAIGGTLLAVLLLAYPAWVAIQSRRVVALDDVSTDPSQAVPFSRSPKALAARHGLLHEPAAFSSAQPRAYPDIRPLTLEVSVGDAYKAALKLVAQRHWTLVDTQAPTGRVATGFIDVVARSAVMGFPDDVTIRITAQGTGASRVDLRSASRSAGLDLGANAARIEAFASDLEDAVDDE